MRVMLLSWWVILMSSFVAFSKLGGAVRVI
jgi:hypothetical protein